MMNNCFIGTPRDVFPNSGCRGEIDEEVQALILSKTVKLAKGAIIRSFEKADFSSIGKCIQAVESNDELNGIVVGSLKKVVSVFTTCYIRNDAYPSAAETSKEFVEKVLSPLRNDAEVRAAMKSAMLRIANGG